MITWNLELGTWNLELERSSLELVERRFNVKQMIPISLKVNGVVREDEVEPRMLLVHYLREVLGLTGTHIGCDTSQCGACTVHLNGQAVKSCTVLAAQADGADITTIEGLAG